MKTKYNKIAPYKTKDGSLIRELLHPQQHELKNQSLAEATVPSGTCTHLHRHHITEEIYHVTAGCGLMVLGKHEFEITVGDSIAIPPGTPHKVCNNSASPLVILCCCSPAYSHEDTVLLET